MSEKIVELITAIIVSVVIVAIALCGVAGVETLLADWFNLGIEHLVTALLAIIAFISIKKDF